MAGAMRVVRYSGAKAIYLKSRKPGISWLNEYEFFEVIYE